MGYFWRYLPHVTGAGGTLRLNETATVRGELWVIEFGLFTVPAYEGA
jgi:hypothetical protein